MNFIEAYQLVDKFAGVLANQPKKRNGFLVSEKLLPDTKSNILNAYKLFFAHVLLYRTRTPEQLDKYVMTIMFLDTMFASEDKVKKQEWAYKALCKRSAIYKIFHKKDVELAKIILKETMSPDFPSKKELLDYFGVLIEYEKNWRKRLNSRLDAGESYSVVFAEMQYEYCEVAYQNANIEMDALDPEYFFPFETLRKASKNPKLKDIHGKYASYYETHQ